MARRLAPTLSSCATTVGAPGADWRAHAGYGRCCAARAADSITVLPPEIALRGVEARQQLLVERSRDGQFVGQVADETHFVSSNPQVVTIESGVLKPLANGEATITATAAGATATAHVVVTEMEKSFAWSFRNHVESVFAKTGCNSGACHGALAGKNGFKLSLRGYDPEGDFTTLTRQARGRRMVPTDPGRSLLLTKPSGAVPHKGGLRFSPDSLEYRVLAEWIAAGAPATTADDPRVDRIEILPRGVVLRPGDKQQFLVRAHFTDGHQEDVTRWVKFTSANESVAQIDDAGQVTISGHGEGVLTAWYASRVAVAAVSAPYEKPVAADAFTSAPRRNFIDELVLAKLASLNIPPSPAAEDAEFLRRAYLDTIGVLPAADETRAFLADASADKRDKLIEALLARPEFVDYWAYKWSDLLLVNGDKLRTPALWSYYTWIRNQVEANTPWDDFARQIVTAKGSTLENGATNYYILHGDPLDLAETTSVAFLGMSINCSLPQSSAREVDQQPIFRLRKSFCSRAHEEHAGRREPDRLSGRLGRVDSAPHRQATAPGAARRAGVVERLARGSSPGPGRLARLARESLFQPRDHESGVGQFLRRRPRRKGRRHAADQPGQQRAIAGGRGEVSRRPALRSEGADACDFAIQHVPARQSPAARKYR